MARKLIYGSYITTCVRSNLYQKRERERENMCGKNQAKETETTKPKQQKKNLIIFIVYVHTFVNS